MVKLSPFHQRLSELNRTGLYGHWSGYLSALRYDTSAKHEYFGVRNSAGLFDSSPLYKHRIAGPDAERFLGGVMARDVRKCAPGKAQYTVWCDEEGYLLEDGVLFRHPPTEFRLTCAEPNAGERDQHVDRCGHHRPHRGGDLGKTQRHDGAEVQRHQELCQRKADQ